MDKELKQDLKLRRELLKTLIALLEVSAMHLSLHRFADHALLSSHGFVNAQLCEEGVAFGHGQRV